MTNLSVLTSVETLLLRKLWTAVLSSQGYADPHEFRAQNGHSIDDIDRLLRRRYIGREGDNYRLTVLGIVAAGDDDMRQVLTVGDDIHARLLRQFGDPKTRREQLRIATLAEELRLSRERTITCLRQLSDAIALWCTQYTTDFASADGFLQAGEGVYRYNGMTGVLAEMERWHQNALAEERLLAKPLPFAVDADSEAAPPAEETVAMPEKVTIPWLLKNVPVGLWLGAGAVIVSVFGAGVRVGQIPLVKQLIGVTDAPAAITSQTTCLGLSSTSGTQKAKVTFTNFSDVRTVSVYWLNYDGAAQFQFKIGPRGSQATDSFVSHSWCARDANTGQDVSGVVIRSTSQDVIIPP